MSIIDANTLFNWQQDASENVKVLFTTMPEGPGVKPDIVKKSSQSYIPESLSFDFRNQFADANSKLSNAMCSLQQFSEQASSLGIENQDRLVIYDDFGNFCAARVWFMFKSVGHQQVYLLNGGLPAWLSLGLPITNNLKQAHSTSQYTAQNDKNFKFVNKAKVLNAIEQSDTQILDARSAKRFSGEVEETRPNLRAGHIPSSCNLHYADVLDSESKYLSIDKLEQKFADYKNQELLFSCGSGITACILAQAAYLVGFRDLSVYDGSWSEWGANENLPIEKGSL